MMERNAAREMLRKLSGLSLVMGMAVAGGALMGTVSAAEFRVAAVPGGQLPAGAAGAAAPELPSNFEASGVVVSEPPPPPVTPARQVVSVAPKVVRPAASGARLLEASIPSLSLPKLPVVNAACETLDDAKIYWLLDLAAKARASNPETAPVAARVEQQLKDALGKNMCAAEAQRYVSAMCADPATYDFMQKMVKELPFYVRPLVGDPCKQDLVAAANKWLR